MDIRTLRPSTALECTHHAHAGALRQREFRALGQESVEHADWARGLDVNGAIERSEHREAAFASLIRNQRVARGSDVRTALIGRNRCS